jgi:molybdopterin synthase catalytic subunit
MWPAGTGSSPYAGPSPDDLARRVHVGAEPIDVPAHYLRAQSVKAGAVVQFTGTVRDHSGSARVLELQYEAYPEMAVRILREIIQEAHQRWPLSYAGVVHRTGVLSLGEAAVCVTVAAAHREEAFVACRYIIDTLKEQAPIWKKETLESGAERWVDEGTPGPRIPPAPG